MGNRIPARDTAEVTRDVIRDLGHAVEALREHVTRDIEMLAERTQRDHATLSERLDARLAQGAEKFTLLDERLNVAVATAETAKQATERKPIPWLTVIAMSIPIFTLAGTVLLAMSRKVDGSDLQNYIKATDVQIQKLEERLVNVEKEIAVARTSGEILAKVLEAVAPRDLSQTRRK